MKPIKIVICDDEYMSITHSKRVLTSLLEELGIAFELKCFDDGLVCLEYLVRNNVDLLFMDIFLKDGQMGTELSGRFRLLNQTSKLIFLSSSNDFASESFAVGASYYLLKPLSREGLERALSHCGFIVEDIRIDTGREVISFNPSALIALEAQDKYTVMHTVNGQTKLRCPLIKFTDYLQPPDFLMINRGYIISLEHVERYDDDFFYMENGLIAPIAVRNRKVLQDIYVKWVVNHV